MKKPIVCQIKKKKYYLYKITWIDITGEEDHANIQNSLKAWIIQL
jgi:hypothetical protein